MPKKLQQETIVWRDAWWGYDYPVEPKEVEYGRYLVSTGWLVKEDKDEVVIALQADAAPDDDRSRHLHGIVKKNIVSRRSATVSIPDPRPKKK